MRARKSKVKKTGTKTKPATKVRRGTPPTKRRTVLAAAPADAVSHSVIKQKYRERYEDGSCGDALAGKLRKHLETEDGTIDLVKLQQLAERNDIWASRYASLNPGLARMVVANRLRKLVRAGGSLDWGRSRCRASLPIGYALVAGFVVAAVSAALVSLPQRLH